ncbi:YcxB family protein [Kitasatospora sp. NPDC101176]|uniref:YcxB family protein n=1 Tax=Kitasatospora sp. NPDC101176 TaxID=3364099 RepID=UPI0037FFBFF4
MDDAQDAQHTPTEQAERGGEAEQAELAYTLTVQDFREALTARARATPSGRRMRWLMYAVLALCLVGAVLVLAGRASVSEPLVTMAGATVFVVFGVPLLQARQFHRLTSDKGEFRAVVDHGGVTVANRHSTSTLTWQAAPRYLETPHLFVLLSGDRNASCLTVLPKRGTVEPERLGALLARQLPSPAPEVPAGTR